MSPCTPWPEIALASLAGSVTLGVGLLPLAPWLAPEVQPLTLILSVGWTAWRLLALDRTWAQRRRWQQAPAWVTRRRRPAWRNPPGLAAVPPTPMAAAARLCGADRGAPGARLSLARRPYAGPRTGPGQGRRPAGGHRRAAAAIPPCTPSARRPSSPWCSPGAK